MSDNALRVGGFTLPNPIVMAENMLAGGVLVQNDNHASDNFGGLKRGKPQQEWAFLGGDGRHLTGDDHAHEDGGKVSGTVGGGASTTTTQARTGSSVVAAPTSMTSAVSANAGGPMQVAQRGVVQQRMAAAQYGTSPKQTPSQSPTQSPTQSPIQSPIQGPPQKVRPGVPVQTDAPIKKGITNPLAVPVGIADGLIDFVTHCVGAHIDFLWKDPTKLLRDPLGAIKLNQLEVNPMGHIFKSIEKANQMDNPLGQLKEIPMGLETLPFLKGKAGQPGQVGQAPGQH